MEKTLKEMLDSGDIKKGTVVALYEAGEDGKPYRVAKMLSDDLEESGDRYAFGKYFVPSTTEFNEPQYNVLVSENIGDGILREFTEKLGKGFDYEYALPEQKKFPLYDEKHVKSAVKLFDRANLSSAERAKVGHAIIRKMREYGLPTEDIGDSNGLKRYISEDADPSDVAAAVSADPAFKDAAAPIVAPDPVQDADDIAPATLSPIKAVSGIGSTIAPDDDGTGTDDDLADRVVSAYAAARAVKDTVDNHLALHGSADDAGEVQDIAADKEIEAKADAAVDAAKGAMAAATGDSTGIAESYDAVAEEIINEQVFLDDSDIAAALDKSGYKSSEKNIAIIRENLGVKYDIEDGKVVKLDEGLISTLKNWRAAHSANAEKSADENRKYGEMQHGLKSLRSIAHADYVFGKKQNHLSSQYEKLRHKEAKNNIKASIKKDFIDRQAEDSKRKIGKKEGDVFAKQLKLDEKKNDAMPHPAADVEDKPQEKMKLRKDD